MNIEFFFKNMPVGYFTMNLPPRSEGVFSYMPYRGSGHYEMQQAISELGQAVCNYSTASESVTFVVAACPEYGKLHLTNVVVSTK